MTNLRDFQGRVYEWLKSCFGHAISMNKTERSHRFLEEALELAQATDVSLMEALQLTVYVYGRPVGERYQEIGGVAITLAALCEAHDIYLDRAAEDELVRVWGKIDKIRAKQKAKPKFGPLAE